MTLDEARLILRRIKAVAYGALTEDGVSESHALERIGELAESVLRENADHQDIHGNLIES